MIELSAVAHPNALLFPMLHRYVCFYPHEGSELAPLVEQMFKVLEMYDRSALPGHVTASGIAVRDGKILLIHHPFLRKWLQPGGHIDAGETPQQAAQRELLEETGMRSTLHEWHSAPDKSEAADASDGNDNHRYAMPFDIDIHPIPANPARNEAAHLHYDFRYLLRVDAADAGQPSESDHPLQWRDLRDMEDAHLQRVVLKLSAQSLL
ncbi:MAG: hydrolase [Herbaspirillum sp.]|nr:hydrolase [Herbaspirillum sp.]